MRARDDVCGASSFIIPTRAPAMDADVDARARASDDDDGTSRWDVRDVRGGAEQVHVSSMRDEDVRIGVREET